MSKILQEARFWSLMGGGFILTCCSYPKGGADLDLRLWQMAKVGQLEKVKELLEQGANPNARLEFAERQDWGETPFIRAAYSGHREIVAFLAEAGADVAMVDSDGYTALSAAAKMGHPETVRVLLDVGVDVNLRDGRDWTALFWADTGETWRILLDAGADVNASADSGATPLIVASAYGLAEKVDALLDAGADVNAATDAGETALRFASGNCHAMVVRRLLDAGADVNAKTANGETALMAPLDNVFRFLMEEEIPRERTAEVIRILLDAGANVGAKTDNGLTALDLAKRGRNYSADAIVELLQDAGAVED